MTEEERFSDAYLDRLSGELDDMSKKMIDISKDEKKDRLTSMKSMGIRIEKMYKILRDDVKLLTRK